MNFAAVDDAVRQAVDVNSSPRLIRRYGSRKLYDARESCYVSLDDLARLIREGVDVQVVDRKSGEDVTVQTLGQVIAEQGRRGHSLVASDFLQQAIREGGDAVQRGAQEVREGAKRLLQRVGPVRRLSDDVDRLRTRIDELERTLSEVLSGAAGDPRTRHEEADHGQEEEQEEGQAGQAGP